MIELTRLNGHSLIVNSDLLKFVEASPDTVLTLVTGEKVVVLESCAEVAALAQAYRVRVLGAAWPNAAVAIDALLARAALNAAQRTSGL
jgi:flagellar protein FlbD